VCDIWPYNLTRTERLLKKFGHEAVPYEDYRELLANVKDLDAVIIATPDFKHSEHTVAALKAGKHVYCEKLMSNTIEGARAMVVAARETKKLLQLGHQRRSNPRYIHARDQIVTGNRLLGRITNISGQWHRAVSDDLGYPDNQVLSEAKLGPDTASPTCTSSATGAGLNATRAAPCPTSGLTRSSIYNWMLGTDPSSCMASGGVDYYKTHEWYDNAIAIFEYPTKEGIVRATYDVLTTTSAGGGYHEYFMGDEGSLKISENPNTPNSTAKPAPPSGTSGPPRASSRARSPAKALRPPLKPWEKVGVKKLGGPSKSVVDVRETAALSAWDIPVTFDKAIHQPHLENFFDAVRKGTPLNCPGEAAFASAVTILKINEAVAAKKTLTFAPADFIA